MKRDPWLFTSGSSLARQAGLAGPQHPGDRNGTRTAPRPQSCRRASPYPGVNSIHAALSAAKIQAAERQAASQPAQRPLSFGVDRAGSGGPEKGAEPRQL